MCTISVLHEVKCVKPPTVIFFKYKQETCYLELYTRIIWISRQELSDLLTSLSLYFLTGFSSLLAISKRQFYSRCFKNTYAELILLNSLWFSCYYTLIMSSLGTKLCRI